jgi:hypothetical protein
VLVSAALAASEQGTAPERAADPPPPLPDPRGACIALWNFSESGEGRKEVRGLAEQGTVVATVGFSSDFPDKCQIVVAAPDLAGGFVLIFRQSGGSGEPPGYTLVTPSRVWDLPASAKQWNARGTSDGSIILESSLNSDE